MPLLRSQARLLIKEGKVLINGRQIKKPGSNFDSEVKITVQNLPQYVSRGAQKLEAALKEFKVNPANQIIADIGASTGGFTDLLLQKGAKKVYAIDVGQDQLAQKLRQDPRVINLEKTNVKDLEELPEKVGLAVVDLSYISLTKVLHKICTFLKPRAKIIVLFKPQFECGPGVVNKQGVITNDSIRLKVLHNFLDWCQENQLEVESQIESPIQGKTGNIEYLLLISC